MVKALKEKRHEKECGTEVGSRALRSAKAFYKDRDFLFWWGRSEHVGTEGKRDQAITMSRKSSGKTDGETTQVDHELLFQRIIISGKTPEELALVFEYELSSPPPALFDDSQQLRKPQKSDIANAIWEKTRPLPRDRVQYVLDGWALVQRIPWSQESTYKKICEEYSDYVTETYGRAVVVFNFCEDISTKVDEDTRITMEKAEFLADNTNKQQLIKMLSGHLKRKGCQSYHVLGDADLFIVQKAVECAATQNTELVGDNTDLLVLLIYHAKLESHSLFFKETTKKPRVWDIKDVQKKLGSEVCTHILFLHAIAGCDKTSLLYDIGKGVPIEKFTTSDPFCKQAAVFDAQSPSRKDVVSAGEKALLCLYNGNPEKEGLDSLRHKRFCKKVATSMSFEELKTLPPTSAAAKYHSLRVYYQVRKWKGTADELNPQDWGWEEGDEGLVPVQTHLPPAPPELLSLCACKTGCKNMTCTCKKNGLACFVMCDHSEGLRCENPRQAAR